MTVWRWWRTPFGTDDDPILVPTREDAQQIIDEPGYVYRAVFDAADKDRDMRELAERFAHQDETRAAADWEIVGAMDDDEGLL